MYTKTKIQELLSARAALEAVPVGGDYTAERNRLTAAEAALLSEGWRNHESLSELEQMAY